MIGRQRDKDCRIPWAVINTLAFALSETESRKAASLNLGIRGAISAAVMGTGCRGKDRSRESS